jgi:hypothetical protein
MPLLLKITAFQMVIAWFDGLSEHMEAHRQWKRAYLYPQRQCALLLRILLPQCYTGFEYFSSLLLVAVTQ